MPPAPAGPLVLTHTPRNGCGGTFCLLWLSGWGFGTVSVARDVIAKHDVRGLPIVLLMSAMWVAIACVVLFCFFTRDQLRVEAGRVTYTRRILLAHWSRTVDARDVRNVELRQIARKGGTDDVIAVETPDRTLRFGRALDPGTLVPQATEIRAAVQRETGRPLDPAPALEAARDRVRARHDRILGGALAAAGVQSEQDLDLRPDLKRVAVKRARELAIEEAIGQNRPNSDKPEGPLRTLVGWFAAVIWTGVAVVWVLTAVTFTAHSIRDRDVASIFILIPIDGIALGFVFFLYIIARVCAEGSLKLLRRALGR
jgi:hypothetical protein